MTRETFDKCFYVAEGFVCLPTTAYNKYHVEHPEWMHAPQWALDVLDEAESDVVYCKAEAKAGIEQMYPDKKIKIIA